MLFPIFLIFLYSFSLQGANINDYDNDGYTPLINAVLKKDYQKAEELLKKGADPNIGRDTSKIYYKVNHETLKTPLQYAASLNDLKMIKLLLKYKADVNKKNKLKETAIIFAIDRKYHDIVYFLYPKIKNKKSSVLLAHAVLAGDYELTSFFIKKGVSLNYVSKNDTILTLAIKGKNKEIVKLLLQKDISLLNKPSKNGIYPLMTAINIANMDIFDELIKHKEVNLKIRNRRNQTLLHLAALKYRSDEMIKKLLDLNIDANIKDYMGKTALFYFITRRNSYVMKYLIDKTDLTVKDYTQRTVHFYAVDNYSVFKFLMMKTKVSSLMKDKWGKTLMLYIIDRGDYRVLKMFENELKEKKSLFEEQNLISVAVRRGNYDMVRILVEAGLNVNGVKGKMPPLLKAVELNKVYILYLLLFYKADKNVYYHGRTAWSIAEQFGYRRALFLLRDFKFQR